MPGFSISAPPRQKAGDLIPHATPHAVSVALPTFQDNIDYEEGAERIKQAMTSGYPRFYIHHQIQEVSASLRRAEGLSRCWGGGARPSRGNHALTLALTTARPDKFNFNNTKKHSPHQTRPIYFITQPNATAHARRSWPNWPVQSSATRVRSASCCPRSQRPRAASRSSSHTRPRSHPAWPNGLSGPPRPPPRTTPPRRRSSAQSTSTSASSPPPTSP